MNETAQLAKFTAEMEFDKLPPPSNACWTGLVLRCAERTKNLPAFCAKRL